MTVSLVLHWLHVSAVVLWIGGLGFNLMILMPNLKQIDLSSRSKLVSKILSNFLRLAWISIAVIVATGLYRVVFVNNMMTWTDFTGSFYGLSLVAKMFIVIAMIVLAAVITFKFKPMIVRHVAIHIEGAPVQQSCSACASMLKRTRGFMVAVFVMSFVVIFIATFLRGA
ncbi:MAG: CopD family protein [Nitrososphaerales archaeon]